MRQVQLPVENFVFQSNGFNTTTTRLQVSPFGIGWQRFLQLPGLSYLLHCNHLCCYSASGIKVWIVRIIVLHTFRMQPLISSVSGSAIATLRGLHTSVVNIDCLWRFGLLICGCGLGLGFLDFGLGTSFGENSHAFLFLSSG